MAALISIFSKFNPLKICILLSGFFARATCQNHEHESAEKHLDPIEFSTLNLNVRDLIGSRWSLEQSRQIAVHHAIEIVDMVKVDVETMSIRVDFHLRQRWHATGLKLPEGLFKDEDPDSTFITAEESVLKSVWSPDSFIPNARETKIQSAGAVQSVVNIYKNRTIIFKARMYTILSCSFTFEWYPLDVQVCELTIESYRAPVERVIYYWENGTAVSNEQNIILYQYSVKLPPKIITGTHKRWAGVFKYPFVKAIFRFERNLGNNIIQIFIPTILVVILSFFSFWLGLDAIPGRISLLITCLLTLVTMHSGLRGVIPTVHYIKMMDIWIIGCMCFVFGAILVMIIVIYMKLRIQQAKLAKEENDRYRKNMAQLQNNFRLHLPAEIGRGVANTARKREAWQNKFQEGPPSYISSALEASHGDFPGLVHPVDLMLAGKFPPSPPSLPTYMYVDKICRFLFPLLFVAFNAAYWPILLTGSAKQHADSI